jgi:hypothetical protein
LQGEARVTAGKIISFQHPEFGNLYFGFDDVRFYKAPSTLSLAQKKLAKAKDVEACLNAAR